MWSYSNANTFQWKVKTVRIEMLSHVLSRIQKSSQYSEKKIMLLHGIFLRNRQDCHSYVLSKLAGKTAFSISIFTHSHPEILPIEGAKGYKLSTA